MSAAEAIAVYLYLKDRPPGGMSKQESLAFNEAWRMVVKTATDAMYRHAYSTITPALDAAIQDEIEHGPKDISTEAAAQYEKAIDDLNRTNDKGEVVK